MNREEAIQKAEKALNDPIAKGGGVALLELDHLRVLLEALRGPQPNPETGMMPCGCGRAMRVDCYPGNHGLADAYQVTCYDCNVGTLPMRSAGKAQVAWNRAMGRRVEE